MAHGVVQEFDLQRGIGSIGIFSILHREHGFENRLEATDFTLAMEQVHLKELVVAPLLDINEIRDRHQRADLREIMSLAVDVLLNAHGSPRELQ